MDLSAPMIRRCSWQLVLLLLLAAWLHFTPANQAAFMKISPDSVEYVSGARRLALGQSYTIAPDGAPLPPRYPPFISYLFAPLFLIGDHPGLPIYLIGFFALMTVFLSYRLTRRMAGESAAFCAAAMLAALPIFREWSAEIMTDIPATAFAFWSICAMMKVADRDEPEPPILRLGLILAAAFMLRPALAVLGLGAALVFLRRFGLRGAWPRLLWVAAPPFLVGLSLLIWNQGAYGALGRNGYQYWASDLYDHPERLFPAGAMLRNLRHLLDTGLLQGLGLAVVILGIHRFRRGPKPATSGDAARMTLLGLILVVGLPYLLLHLRYYSFRPRYFLPLFPPVIALLAATLPLVLGRLQRALLFAALLGLGVLGVLKAMEFNFDSEPRSRVGLCMQLEERVPDDALVLTALPPDYLRCYLRPESKIEFLILSRDEEYASKERAPATRGGISKLPVVRRTADEDPEELIREVVRGRPVYLLRAGLFRPRSVAFVKAIASRLRCREVVHGLDQLLPR